MIRNESGASFYLWWIVVCGRIPIPRLIKQARRLALLCFALLRIFGDAIASWILFSKQTRRLALLRIFGDTIASWILFCLPRRLPVGSRARVRVLHSPLKVLISLWSEIRHGSRFCRVRHSTQ
jgi:hypothetical protein